MVRDWLGLSVRSTAPWPVHTQHCPVLTPSQAAGESFSLDSYSLERNDGKCLRMRRMELAGGSPENPARLPHLEGVELAGVGRWDYSFER